MTSFNTGAGSDGYFLRFETDDKEQYLYMQEAARPCLDGEIKGTPFGVYPVRHAHFIKVPSATHTDTPRYIDANKLCEGLVSNDPIVIAAKCEPTADVAPVIHAHWVYEGIFDGNAEYTCSRCHRNAVVFISVERSPVDVVYPYCHCGAKMDEEVEQ